MPQYIIRRLLLMIPTLIGMTLMLFVMARFAPGLTGGGAFDSGGSQNAHADRELAQKNMLTKLHMLDANGNPIPLPRQYLNWLWDAVHLRFGDSVKYNTPVSDLIWDRLPVTLLINAIASVVIYGLALPGGMLAAVKRGKGFDTSWGFITLALFSLPVIWTGNMAIAEFANPKHFAWFPAAGIHSIDTTKMSTFQYVLDYLWHLVLPIFVMTLGGFAYLSKLMRASMIDNMHQDYTRTAQAKGLSRFKVIAKHVLRNSLLPMITIFATVIPGMLGGSVIIEEIFSIEGMGKLAFTAANSRDLPVLQALTFIGSVLTLGCFLIADFCYALADPRVSYE